MNFWIKIAEIFGTFNKIRKWLQGKKTYTVNIAQAITGLSAMLVLGGQMADLVGQTISLLAGWADPAIVGPQLSTGQAMDAVKTIWANHATMVAGFTAGFYAVSDAFSKMASYAAKERVHNDMAFRMTLIHAHHDESHKEDK